MSEYNLTIFDLEEGKEYESSSKTNDSSVANFRRGPDGVLEYEYEPTAWRETKVEHGERFREIKPKKKLYAYITQLTSNYILQWNEDPDMEEKIRIPEFDREL